MSDPRFNQVKLSDVELMVLKLIDLKTAPAERERILSEISQSVEKCTQVVSKLEETSQKYEKQRKELEPFITDMLSKMENARKNGDASIIHDALKESLSEEAVSKLETHDYLLSCLKMINQVLSEIVAALQTAQKKSTPAP